MILFRFIGTETWHNFICPILAWRWHLLWRRWHCRDLVFGWVCGMAIPSSISLMAFQPWFSVRWRPEAVRHCSRFISWGSWGNVVIITHWGSQQTRAPNWRNCIWKMWSDSSQGIWTVLFPYHDPPTSTGTSWPYRSPKTIWWRRQCRFS